MQHEDQFSEDLIKIFHNAKGSVRNKIIAWTENESLNELNRIHVEWKPFSGTSFDRAAGEYEPLSQNERYAKSENSSNQLTLRAMNTGERNDHLEAKRQSIIDNVHHAIDIQINKATHDEVDIDN